MRGRRSTAVAFLVALGLLGPILRAGADTAFLVVFNDGKMFVQCPPGPATGIVFPGLGVNKGKKCVFVLSESNAHGINDTCVGIAVSDALKKGNKKAPQAGLCSISASGVIGPRLKWPGPTIKIPAEGAATCAALGKTPDAPNPDPPGGCDIEKQQQFGGPWCGAAQGEDGSGTITIGTKTISFDHLRFQWQGPIAVVTALGFKPGFGKPGQAGPIYMILFMGPDFDKIIGGVPKSSCLVNAKNLKVGGIVAGLLLGVK